MSNFINNIFYIIYELLHGLILQIIDVIPFIKNILYQLSLSTDPSIRPSPSKHLFPQFFVNSRGYWIYKREWIPVLTTKTKDIRGVIFIVHGLNEYVDRYHHVAQYLNELGFACFGIDHQGFGNSDGYRSYCDNLDDYVKDYSSFCHHIINEKYNKILSDPTKYPRFLLGHSMGGLLAARIGLALQDESFFNGGVILSAPAIGLKQFDGALSWTHPDNNKFVYEIAKLLSKIIPKAYLAPVLSFDLSHDKSIMYRANHDPLMVNHPASIKLGYEIYMKGHDCRNNAEKVTYPLLCFVGDEDILVDAKALEIFYNGISSEVKEMRVFEGVMHETVNESEKKQEEIMNYMKQWVLQRVSDI